MSKTISLSLSGINSNKIERSLPEIVFSAEMAIFNSDVTSAFLLSMLSSWASYKSI